jgi:hypothetical protein
MIFISPMVCFHIQDANDSAACEIPDTEIILRTPGRVTKF